MFQKKKSFLFLGIAVSVTLFIFLFRPNVVFDYDFESFFPQDDTELSFYQTFRNEFENDNDYLLIALGNSPDIFDPAFLQAAGKINSLIQNLTSVEKTVSLLDLEEPTINPFGIRYDRLLDWSNPEKLEESRNLIQQSEELRGNLISKESRYLLLIVKNEQRISKEDGDLLYASIKSILEDSAIEDYFSAGKIKAQGEFVSLLQKEFAFFLGISFLLIVTLLYLIFRSWWGILVPVVVLAFGILWTISLSLYAGKPLDVMTVMQPTILSVIGLAALVHFFNHYLKFLRKGYEKEKAIEKAFSELVLAVFLTCLTTALGFISLYFTSIPSLKLFGLYTGMGVILMFCAVVMVGPGLLYLIAPSTASSRKDLSEKWHKGMRNLFLWTLYNQRLVVVLFILVSIFSLFAASKVQVNGYILDNLPRDHELVEEFNFFDKVFGGSKPLEFYVEVGDKAETLMDLNTLRELDKLEQFISTHYSSAAILSPVTLIKGLNKAQNSGNPKAYAIPSQGQWLRMQDYIEKASESVPSKVISSDYKRGRISTRTEDMGSLRSKVLNRGLEDFLENEIDPGLLKVKLTGTSHLIDISHESVTKQMGKGFGIAFVIVAVIMGFLFRSWRMSLVVLVPNIIPLLWLFGLMWILGVELKLTTAILFTVAFGIAVDDSIHFMSKLRLEMSEGKSWFYALKRTYLETGKAIILTTAILVSGFSVLTLSEFGVTYYTGLLISMSLIFALLADLLLLPILLIPFKKIKKISDFQSSRP